MNARDPMQMEAMAKWGENGSETKNDTKVFFLYIEDVPALVKDDDCFSPKEAKSARKSMPSGHTSIAFAGATY